MLIKVASTLLLPLLGSFIFAILALKIPGVLPVDIPNERSSHTKPTPRSGPILSLLFLILILPLQFPTKVVLALLVLSGFIDDHFNLKPSLKFILIFGLTAVLFFICHISFWYLIPLVGFANFVNFMDGVNGLMLTQLLIISFSGYYFTHFQDYYLILTLGIAGFLFLNFPKPKFYSGDCTSLSLPIIILFPLLHSTEFHLKFLTLTSLLWIDALLTIFARLSRGEKFYQAHKSHAYQRLHQMGLGHTQVTLWAALYTGLNFISLLLIKSDILVLGISLTIGSLIWYYIQETYKRLNKGSG